MAEGINVLSLFDGISCGQLALQRAEIKVNQYFASEIAKHAIKVTMANFPNTIQLGSITEIKNIDWSQTKIDLVIGGSPCQGFSFAGKQLNFDDPRSKLFFEYVRILNEIKLVNPDVKFFLENVKMKKDYQDVISKVLGVEPIEVNSNLVSAQNRKRLYWSNINGFEIPEDKGILLKDIVVETEIKGLSEAKISRVLETHRGKGFFYNPQTDDKIGTIIAQYAKEPTDGSYIFQKLNEFIVPFEKTLMILEKEINSGKVGYFRKDSQANRVYYIHGKAVTLCGDAGGGAAKMGQYLFGEIKREVHQVSENKESNNQQPYMQNRVHNSNGLAPALTQESGRINISVENDYLFGCLTPDKTDKRQNGQRFNEGNKFYTLTAQDKHGILIEGYIRKLTPVECERLQTVPDQYTECISNSQRYKALGNGWTVDVIVEFFKHIKPKQ